MSWLAAPAISGRLGLHPAASAMDDQRPPPSGSRRYCSRGESSHTAAEVGVIGCGATREQPPSAVVSPPSH